MEKGDERLAAKVRITSLVVMMILSVVLGLIIFAYIVASPEVFGVSNSPIRQVAFYVTAGLIYGIPGLICIRLFSRKPEWIAPPGKYTPEAKYSVFSPYALAASAVVAAAGVVAGFPGPINIDIVAMVTAFSAVYFGPAVSFLGTFVAFILRYLIGLTPWVATPNILIAYAILDGGVWSVNSLIFWYVIRGFKLKGNVKSVATVLMAFVFMAIHFFGWCGVNYFTNNPFEAAVANLMCAIGPTGFVMSSWAAQMVGTLIGAFYYDSRLVKA